MALEALLESRRFLQIGSYGPGPPQAAKSGNVGLRSNVQGSQECSRLWRASLICRIRHEEPTGSVSICEWVFRYQVEASCDFSAMDTSRLMRWRGRYDGRDPSHWHHRVDAGMKRLRESPLRGREIHRTPAVRAHASLTDDIAFVGITTGVNEPIHKLIQRGRKVDCHEGKLIHSPILSRLGL